MQLKSADSYTTSSNDGDISLENILIPKARRGSIGFDNSRSPQLNKDLIRYALEFELPSAKPFSPKVFPKYQKHQKDLEQSNQPTEDGQRSAIKALLISRFRLNKALLATQANLVDLFRGEDEEPLPTEDAFVAAWQLVYDAYIFLRDDFPKASAATDDEGGIRLRWRSADLAKDVRLYCPGRPERKSYIYHQAGDEYEGVYDVTDSTLAKWLHWLNEDR